MILWLGLSCPECGDTRDLSQDDRGKLKAKHPVECSHGHRFRREDGFLTWLLDKNPFGSALISADSAFEGEFDVTDLGKPRGATHRLPRDLRSARVCSREPEDWSIGREKLLLVYVRDRTVRAIPASFRADTKVDWAVSGIGPLLAGSLSYQVVGSADPDKLPGWRQVLAEAFVAYEAGRHNVAALLGNVAFETFYSSVADPILLGRGMPETVVQLIHGNVPLENRLGRRFAHPLGLPCLSDAPFWSEWKRKSRQCRNSLAHRWIFDQKRKKAQATQDDARWLLFYHLKALCHLDPQCFDWLLMLEAKKMTPR